MITLRSIPFLVTTACYLLLGAWVMARRKSAAQQLYGAICFVTCLWQALWVLLMFDPLPDSAVLWTQVCYTGIVFIPPIFHRFIQEFKQRDSSSGPVYFIYGIPVLFVISLWATPYFLHGFWSYSWGASPRAGWLHPLFGFFIAFHLVRILRLLNAMRHDPAIAEIKKRQASLVMFATLLYSAGAVDLLPSYGVRIFPPSFMFTGIALLLFGYAMFRYEFLAIALPHETEGERARREAASTEMRRLGMAAAFPLVSQGELLGYLLLGEKMSEESYSKEDLLLLRIVANQAALAYQRVRYLEMAVHGARTEMLGEIAGGFAHEIKTPLANISLPAELTFMDLQELEQGKRKIEDLLPELKARMKDIMVQAFKASEKIEAIRQFSKPGQVKLESVELSHILQNSLALLDHLLKKTNTKVKTQFPSIMSPIRGDAKQLEIVFVNLIKNAAEAMTLHTSAALSRQLWLTGREEGDWIIVTVKDSGPGIKRTDFGHLFEAYFTTKGSVGTGMGLFLSQQVIKAHGGRIDVKSEEGRGTEFIIRLPKHISQEHTGVHQAA